MRLTLRTLLAYLDDMLEPAQAKAIGQKAAESDSARELMERIKQVTRKRRLTTPPPTGSGSIDANTIADYLDNVVSPEQAAEVEQICLASDVHLAEVAACHQILTLVLGEPAVVPPSAHQRSYALVKGPEAIHLKKPAAVPRPGVDHSDHMDHDETLRLGMPPVGKGGLSNPLVLVAGGLVAAALLVVAILQVLDFTAKDRNGTGNIAQVDPNKDKAKDGGNDDKQNPPKDKTDTDKKDSDKKDGNGKDKNDPDKKDPDPKDIKLPPPPVVVDIPFTPPNPREAPIGQMALLQKEPSILLQAVPEGKTEWKRIQGKKPEVYSGRTLVALPGFRAKVETHRGVDVVLWGSSPELFEPMNPKQAPPPPILESVVELHQHDKLDLDLTLRRGRILLQNNKDKPVLVRVRYENPSQPNLMEHFDVTLDTPQAAILLDRLSFYSPNEPFYKDPKHPNRLGPNAFIGSVVLNGTVYFKTGELTFTLEPPPGPAMMSWNSAQGPSNPRELPALPTWTQPNHAPKEGDVRKRKDFLKARDNLAQSLTPTKSVDVALEEAVQSTDPFLRVLAVRCRAALDDLPSLLDALDQEKARDLRREAALSLERWIAASRGHDYKLYDLLKNRGFKVREAEVIMELLHPLSPKALAQPATYEHLIDCLVNTSLVVRELGHHRLQGHVPAGAGIPYSAAAPDTIRDAAFDAWRRLIPQGQLPPTGAPMKK